MKSILVLAVVALLAGCDALSDEPEYIRVPGMLLTNDSSTPTIQVPSRIRPGVPTQVIVTTQSVGCNEQGDTEVEFVDGAVEIRPYDVMVVYDPERFCTLEEKPDFPHTVSVTFPAEGPILVRAVGRSPVGYEDGAVRYETQTHEIGVVVR